MHGMQRHIAVGQAAPCAKAAFNKPAHAWPPSQGLHAETKGRSALEVYRKHMQTGRRAGREERYKEPDGHRQKQQEGESERGSPPPSQWVLTTQSVWCERYQSQSRHSRRWGFQEHQNKGNAGLVAKKLKMWGIFLQYLLWRLNKWATLKLL